MSKRNEWGCLPWSVDPEGMMIFDGNMNRVLDIRGWGHLTGQGGLNLPVEEAARLQKEMLQRICDRMNGPKGE